MSAMKEASRSKTKKAAATSASPASRAPVCSSSPSSLSSARADIHRRRLSSRTPTSRSPCRRLVRPSRPRSWLACVGCESNNSFSSRRKRANPCIVLQLLRVCFGAKCGWPAFGRGERRSRRAGKLDVECTMRGWATHYAPEFAPPDHLLVVLAARGDMRFALPTRPPRLRLGCSPIV